MSNPKVQNTQKPYVSKHSEPYKADPIRIFSQDQIRTRAYQIYESGNRNDNTPEADWSQAETELMELLHAK
jgi:hypothetical protein